MNETEYKRYMLEMEAYVNGTALLTIAVQPGGWVNSSSGMIKNDTDELISQEVEVEVVDGIIDLEVGCHSTIPVEVSGYFTLLSFTQGPGTSILFHDSFESLVDLNKDEYEWYIQTPLNDWMFSWEPINEQIPEETYFTLNNGFEFTLSESTTASTRQINILPLQYWEEEFLSETTNIVLEVDTEFISHDLQIHELPFYGFWVVGTDAALWIDLRPLSYFEADESLIKYPDLSGWYQSSPYEYIVLGEGQHTIDISQFDEYLGGGVVSIMFSAYLKILPW
ncbi:hypothetical protein [Desulfobacter postgatei]|uniref:hypothetical protein n=1 Tax=Desulfobacter postgatei TaxID=2293 RepID=UPI00259B1B42|nr:hypothetical protein [uncultured Desulfobacter sp.]